MPRDRLVVHKVDADEYEVLYDGAPIGLVYKSGHSWMAQYTAAQFATHIDARWFGALESEHPHLREAALRIEESHEAAKQANIFAGRLVPRADESQTPTKEVTPVAMFRPVPPEEVQEVTRNPSTRRAPSGMGVFAPTREQLPEHKVCSRCGVDKPRDEYQIDNRVNTAGEARAYLRPDCRPCELTRKRELKQARREAEMTPSGLVLDIKEVTPQNEEEAAMRIQQSSSGENRQRNKSVLGLHVDDGYRRQLRRWGQMLRDAGIVDDFQFLSVGDERLRAVDGLGDTALRTIRRAFKANDSVVLDEIFPPGERPLSRPRPVEPEVVQAIEDPPPMVIDVVIEDPPSSVVEAFATVVEEEVLDLTDGDEVIEIVRQDVEENATPVDVRVKDAVAAARLVTEYDDRIALKEQEIVRLEAAIDPLRTEVADLKRTLNETIAAWWSGR